VTVNTISPGYIGTKMVMAIPQEVLDSKILPLIAQVAPGQAGRSRRPGGLPGVGRSGLRHRRQHLHQRRSAHVLIATGGGARLAARRPFRKVSFS
jgi:NAD(P)-dependent dehydrogenase (short-subunit alcohol dehydrogenase family)